MRNRSVHIGCIVSSYFLCIYIAMEFLSYSISHDVGYLELLILVYGQCESLHVG